MIRVVIEIFNKGKTGPDLGWRCGTPAQRIAIDGNISLWP